MSASAPALQLRPDKEPSNDRDRVMLERWRSELQVLTDKCKAQANPPALMAQGRELSARIQQHHVDFYDCWRKHCDSLERCSACQQVVLDYSLRVCAYCDAQRPPALLLLSQSNH